MDSSGARQRIKLLHTVVQRGALWIPEEQREITEMRRTLRQYATDYTVEFIWIMSRYGACSRADADQLIRGNILMSASAEDMERVRALLEALPEAVGRPHPEKKAGLGT